MTDNILTEDNALKTNAPALTGGTKVEKELQMIIKGEVDILREELRQRNWVNSHLQYFAEMFSLMMSILNDQEEDVQNVRLVKYFLDGDDYKDIALLTGMPVLQVMATIRKFGRAFLRTNNYKALLEQNRQAKADIETLSAENSLLKVKIAQLKKEITVDESKSILKKMDNAEKDFLKSLVEEWPVSVRLRNALKGKGLYTAEHVLLFNHEELKRIRNLGEKTFLELEKFMNEHGYILLKDKTRKTKT